jgi:hypothetical protein
MNERIKKLALQALKHPDNDNDGLTVFDDDELQKFVQSIVQDCINVVADAVDHREPASIYVDKIKQQFGMTS